MPSRIFQTESSTRNFKEGTGNFQQESNFTKGILWEGGYFMFEELSAHDFPVRKFFMDCEPDLPALFERHSEINFKKEFFQLKLRSNNKNKNEQKLF